MKVYLVLRDKYEPFVIAVYSTEKRAKKFVEAQAKKEYGHDTYYEIEEWLVDDRGATG